LRDFALSLELSTYFISNWETMQLSCTL